MAEILIPSPSHNNQKKSNRNNFEQSEVIATELQQ